MQSSLITETLPTHNHDYLSLAKNIGEDSPTHLAVLKVLQAR